MRNHAGPYGALGVQGGISVRCGAKRRSATRRVTERYVARTSGTLRREAGLRFKTSPIGITVICVAERYRDARNRAEPNRAERRDGSPMGKTVLCGARLSRAMPYGARVRGTPPCAGRLSGYIGAASRATLRYRTQSCRAERCGATWGQGVITARCGTRRYETERSDTQPSHAEISPIVVGAVRRGEQPYETTRSPTVLSDELRCAGTVRCADMPCETGPNPAPPCTARSKGSYRCGAQRNRASLYLTMPNAAMRHSAVRKPVSVR
jgi:hypothetical protein